MTTSLAILLRDPDLGLRLLTGRPGTEVSWAHSSDLADPTPFLEPNNLLLTTGAQFSPGIAASPGPAAGFAEYVSRLRAIGVAALGFGTEVVSATPDQLVTACDTQGLPLLEVPYRTPFIAIGRRIADALAEQAHARDAWALEAQRAVSLAALSADRIEAVLQEVARRLDAQVLLLDAQTQALSEHGKAGFSQAERAEIQKHARGLLRARLRSGAALQLAGRVVSMQALGRREELRGVLAVAVTERPDSAATALITSAVALAEFAVEDSARRQEFTLALNAAMFRLCLNGHPSAASEVLAVAGLRLPEPPVQVLLARLGPTTRGRSEREPSRPDSSERDSDNLHGAAELEHALRLRVGASRVLSTRWEGGFAAVVNAEAGRAAAEVLSTRRGTVVTSRPTGWAGLPAALHRARAALDTAPADAGMIELRTGPILGLLARAEVESLARERLSVLDRDPDGPGLRRCLEVWLRHNAAWEPAARQLHLHRHTLKAQVHRAGQLLGLDLATFEAKAEAWALLSAAAAGDHDH